jgi:hypothetical protein
MDEREGEGAHAVAESSLQLALPYRNSVLRSRGDR